MGWQEALNNDPAFRQAQDYLRANADYISRGGKQSDPAYQEASRRWVQANDLVRERMQAAGAPSNYSWTVNNQGDGGVHKKDSFGAFLAKSALLAAPVALASIPAFAGAAGSGGGTAATTAGTGAAGGGVGAGTTAGIVGGATGWKKFLPEIISAGSSIAQSGLAARAEGKAAKQQQAAAERAAAIYAPYNTLGTQSAQRLADYLGLPGLPQGQAPVPMQAGAGLSSPSVMPGRMAVPLVNENQTLASLLARHRPPDEVPRGTASGRTLPSGSSRGRSSYRGMEAS